MRPLLVIFILFWITASAEVTEKDIKDWHAKAEQGDTRAQSTLAACYLLGVGVLKDDSEAFKWYHEAAMLGDSTCQFAVGRCYYFGTGVPKDLVEAYAYFNLAAITSDHAAGTRSFVAKEMTQDQIEAGQKRSKKIQKEMEPKWWQLRRWKALFN